MRRKTAHKRKAVVNFRVSPRKIVFGFFAVIALLLLNPSPAELTPKNVYEKVGHMVFRHESEYLSEAYVSDILAQDGTFNETLASAAIYENEKVSQQAPLPSSFLATVLPLEQKNADDKVLSAVNDAKWIEIDLSDQKIFAWENGEKKMEFLVSSGKPWTPTPTGEYRIWIKLRHANMKGGSKERGDYYFLPNVPYVMYFHKGYGIHGAYWHMNFGQQMSHGCVNMRPEEAGQLFAWAGPDMQGKNVIKPTNENPGTRIVIHN